MDRWWKPQKELTASSFWGFHHQSTGERMCVDVVGVFAADLDAQFGLVVAVS